MQTFYVNLAASIRGVDNKRCVAEKSYVNSCDMWQGHRCEGSEVNICAESGRLGHLSCYVLSFSTTSLIEQRPL